MVYIIQFGLFHAFFFYIYVHRIFNLLNICSYMYICTVAVRYLSKLHVQSVCVNSLSSFSCSADEMHQSMQLSGFHDVAPPTHPQLDTSLTYLSMPPSTVPVTEVRGHNVGLIVISRVLALHMYFKLRLQGMA